MLESTVLLWLAAVLSIALAAATTPSRTVPLQEQKRAAGPFVTANGGTFQLNGSPFKFIGTDAYWLHSLNNDQDIINTFASIKAAGINVVRTWAFNDVDAIPNSGVWFQLITPGGVTTINDGPNGLQRLDRVVQIAESMGMFLMLTLTNNWNPFPQPNTVAPRNFLSNDYGGMDLYIRQFSAAALLHGQFYVDQLIINSFKNYSAQVVPRYVNSPAIFAWEIANDPRCNSTLPAGPLCNPHAVTSWVSNLSQHIQSLDPNHLISSGNHGFFCVGCAKLFPPTPTPTPEAHPSPVARDLRNAPLAATKQELKKKRKEAKKRARKLRKKTETSQGDGPMIRGRWHSPASRRQDSPTGPAFDGSFGVDSEDISNIPGIGFGAFQLFPDQNQYFAPDPTLPAFNNTVQEGVSWIQRQAQAGASLGKPVIMTAFGLVTQDNTPSFVPFNSTSAPMASQGNPGTNSFGATDQQRNDAYGQWLSAGIVNGLQGMIQYQWGQSNLTAQSGTSISPQNNGTTQSPNPNMTGESPNDGYSLSGPGQADGVATLTNAVPKLASGP